MLAMAGILRRSDAAAAGDGIRAKSHASLHHGLAEVESLLLPYFSSSSIFL
jgi:hypothetical protein